jgi:hypothetical protein
MEATDGAMKRKFEWTNEQREIIQASSNSRLLVEAGPGTGKTAVACARVAALVDQGVQASSILMFSFTRTAVAELRARIRSFSTNPEITAVRIATLDSQAWFFRYGTGADFESLTNTFESNIEETIRLLQSGNDVLNEYLQSTNHLIIDEAQDLTAIRARFVAELIGKMPRDCGVTVFADPCQGIYGFTNDFEDGSGENGTFIQSFSFSENGFENRRLTTLHRTSDQAIIAAFRAFREAVVEQSSWPTMIVETIQEHCPKLVGGIRKGIDQDCLVLYRRRAQALMDAQHYPYYHRLRMSGLPACIHPWIGAIFATYTENTINLEQFVELWESTVDIDSLLYESILSEEAWNLLRVHAASKYGGVNLVRLRELLSRSKPHADFLIPDYGMWGPIFSTIHGSKGREADNVVLMLPRNDRTLTIPDDQPNSVRRNQEESRVYYVGATRAKSSLVYDEAKSLIGASSVNGGRVWHSYQRGRNKPATACVQFGMAGDFDDTALVRRDFSDSREEAVENFEALLSLHRQYVNDAADMPPAIDLQLEPREVNGVTEWRYRLHHAVAEGVSEQIYGWLNASVGNELFTVAKEMESRVFKSNLRPPTRISGYVNNDDEYQPALRMLGLRTVVVSPENQDDLHEPFRSSGFLVAPVICGFPSVMFQFARRQ